MKHAFLFALTVLLTSSSAVWADSRFVVQFFGEVPEEIRALVNVERVDGGRCARSCVVTTNVRTFQRNERGNAALSLNLPECATRVCVHELSPQVAFEKAALYMDRERRYEVSHGEDFDNYVAPESWGGHRAPDGHTYFACSPIGADAKSAYGLVISVKR